MGGQKFQYDESGGTFFYFLLSFLALLLIPGTYYCWPRKRKEDPGTIQKRCQCNGCIKKRKIMQASQPWKTFKELMVKFLIIAGWVILCTLAYKVSQFDYEFSNFDPYEILGIPFGAPQKEIRKAYHKLSLVLHPDKETGDEKAFMKLTKAYQALTDEEARSNWEKYGNPDGPGAMSFGIALPSWIVEKQNSVWVLGLYALVFMVALPTVVGMWWYRSIRYTGDKVLLGTTELYYYFMYKTTSIPLKRCIMILAASLEFDKKHNSEVMDRYSDHEEIPHLIKKLPNLSEKNREAPLCWMYSIKARALIHAHLSRIPLNPETLDIDRMSVIKKCPYLIKEMVHCAASLILLAYSRRVPRLLNIFTVENVMKMSPMIVQGLWDLKSPFLQLPHIKEEHLRFFFTKKRRIRTLRYLALMKSADRQSVFRFLTNDQYNDVMNVLSQMPNVDLIVQSEVVDDENPTVYTAGAIVTVTVTLKRQNLEVLMISSDTETQDLGPEDEEENKEEEEEPKKPLHGSQMRKPVNQKHQKGGQKKNEKNKPSPSPTNKTVNVSAKSASNKTPTKYSDSDGDASHSDKEDYDGDSKKVNGGEDDDAEWETFQSKMNKREKALEGKSKISHSVHSPLFPDDKQEYWWVYISDRKSNTLLTPPYHVTSLVDTEVIQLLFTAPRWPGMYTFHVCLRSDSYLGFDQVREIKLDVKEAPAVPTEHPQWDVSEEEEEPEDEAGNDSEFTTDEDVEDDD